MDDATTIAPALVESKRYPLLIDLIIRLVREKPLGTAGGVIVLAMLLTGAFANFLAPYGMNEIHLADSFLAPGGKYLLGTDKLGRDLLSRVIFGARISMIVGIAGATLNVLIGVVIGTISGFFGGKFDLIVQRLVDAWMCFPWLLIVLTIMALVGPGLLQMIIVLGISGGIRDSRVVRSAVIGIKENVYVEAARSIGSTTRRMLMYHILPNIMAPIIIVFTLSVGGMILTEAMVSFLGWGIPPPQPSWGGMLSAEGRDYMLLAPWLALWPGLALSIVVWGVNMLGDALRDILDPRLRGGIGRYGVRNRKGAIKSGSGVLKALAK